MIQNTLAIAVVALAVTAVMAQSDPLSQRKTLMKGNLEGAQNVTKMVRGENPFDPAKVNAAFVQWTETAQKRHPRQRLNAEVGVGGQVL